MAYSIQSATVEDAPAFALIFQKAFEHDHILGYFHPDTPKDILMDKDIQYYTQAIQNCNIYGRRYTKAVEENTGETVALAGWQYPHRATPEQNAEKQRRAEESKKERHPPGSRGELIDYFFEHIDAGRKKWVDPEKTYVMHILAVHPDHQGKGLGGRLLRLGLEEADRAGAQTFIESSPAGLPVYLRYGWKIVDELVVDMRPYGGHGIEHQPFLMREPGAAMVRE